MASTNTSEMWMAKTPQAVSQQMLGSLLDDAAAISQHEPTKFLDISVEVPRGQPRHNVSAGPPGPERTAFWANTKVLVDITNMRAGHGLWSWLNVVSDEDTATIKQWHFNSKLAWLALVVVGRKASPSLMCMFQARCTFPHEIQPNGEVGYDANTAAGRVFRRLVEFCTTRFELRTSQNRGITRVDIYDIFNEFSKLVPVLWVGERMLGKFNPYCASCTFIKPDLSLVECCSGTCIKGSAATVPGPQSCPDWQHNLMLPPPIGPHCSDPVAKYVIATINAISAPMPPGNTHPGATGCLLRSANERRANTRQLAPVHMPQQEPVEVQLNRTAQGQAATLFATRPSTVAAPAVNAPAPPPCAVDAAPPRYAVHAHVRPAVDVTHTAATTPDRTTTGPDATATGPDATATGPDATATDPDATAIVPDATTTVEARASAVRRAEDKNGSGRPRKACRITKKDK